MSERSEGPVLGTFEEWSRAANIDPSTILGWVIWYADGSKFTSKDTDVDSLPPDSCQGAKVFHSRPDSTTLYSYMLVGCDPYWMPNAINKIRGSWVSDEEHDRFFEMMKVQAWPT